jgi:hypothetical protein
VLPWRPHCLPPILPLPYGRGSARSRLCLKYAYARILSIGRHFRKSRTSTSRTLSPLPGHSISIIMEPGHRADRLIR